MLGSDQSLVMLLKFRVARIFLPFAAEYNWQEGSGVVTLGQHHQLVSFDQVPFISLALFGSNGLAIILWCDFLVVNRTYFHSLFFMVTLLGLAI
jgi:hypothetical protein